MSDTILRVPLLQSFQQLQGKFDVSLADAKQLDSSFEQLHKNFMHNMSITLKQAQKKFPKENPLSAHIQTILASIADTDKDWHIKLSKRDKGVGFRQNFQDSLLVFVFGKVKSGKSSLGNYMAWGNTDPDQVLKQATPVLMRPEYFSHANTCAQNGDAADEAKTQREFRVGATEATSSIQGFRLPGLTWVDSPGLHSVNEVNGELAKEYVEHADLILYTMRSDAPGRESDMAELRELQSRGKEVLILITGSDINEEDWDDDISDIVAVLQMKPAHTRQDQKAYIAKELGGVSCDEIVSISARYAQLHADEPEKIADSGMGQLFETLHTISQQNGVRLKCNVPLNNFRQFLQECQQDFQPYQQLINQLDEEIKQLKCSVPRVMATELRAAQHSMRQIIDNSFSEITHMRNDEAGINQALQRAESEWNAKLQPLVDQALHNGLAEITSGLASGTAKSWSCAGLVIPSFTIDKVTKEIPAEVRRGTRNRNSGIGALIGGGIGFFFGGPAGAALGSAIGGGLGHASGDSACVNMRTIEMNVGDNLAEIRSQVQQAYADGVHDIIEQEFNTVLQAVLTDAHRITSSLKTELDAAASQFLALQCSVEQKIQ